MVDVAKVRMFGDYIGTFVWDDSYRVASTDGLCLTNG